jgi:regulator of protease activity HflC (stomatin/prohibitin superfamily)
LAALVVSFGVGYITLQLIATYQNSKISTGIKTPRVVSPPSSYSSNEKEGIPVTYTAICILITVSAMFVWGVTFYTTLSYTRRMTSDWRTVILPAILWMIMVLLTRAYFNYIKKSVVKKPENKIWIMLLFGRYVCDMTPGLWIALHGIVDIIEYSTKNYESDFPDSPEFIDHSDPNVKSDGSAGDGTVKEGFTPAFRVILRDKHVPENETFFVPTYTLHKEDGSTTQIQEEPIHKSNSTLLGQTVEVEGSVSFRIIDGLKFYRSVGKVSEGQKAMNDFVKSSSGGELAKLCPAEVTLFSRYIQENVRVQLVLFTSDWGLEVTKFVLMPIGLSHSYNKERTATASAVEVSRKTILIAKGDAQKRTLEGGAEGDYQRQLLAGKAAGMRELVSATMVDGGMTLAIQSHADALSHSTLIATDPSNLLGSVAGAKLALDAMGGTTPRITLTDGDRDPKTPEPPSAQQQTTQPPNRNARGGKRGRR